MEYLKGQKDTITSGTLKISGIWKLSTATGSWAWPSWRILGNLIAWTELARCLQRFKGRSSFSLAKETHMYPLMNSVMFCVRVGVAIVSVFVINVTFRAILNRRVVEEGRYPHRMGTQLPRTQHLGERDQVIDIAHGK